MGDEDRLDTSGRRDSGSRATTRRGFVRAAVNLGVAGGLARTLESGALDAAADGDVPVVYAYARDDPADPSSLDPRVTWVPGDWYASMESAFELRHAILDAGLDGLLGTFVVPGTYDETTASVAVDGTDEAVRDRVREVAADADVDATPDVSVRVRDPPSPPDRDDPDNRRGETPESSVPGGVYCGSPSSGGTLAPAMYASEGPGEPTAYFATSNHLYSPGGTGTTEHAGEPLYLHAREDDPRIGVVDRGYPNEDVVRVRPVDGYRPVSRIAGAEPSVVAGQFTRWGLADLRAREEPLTKIGALGGRTTGQIQGVAGITYYVGDVPKDGQLKWGGEDSMTDGDSGSVAYHPDPDAPDEQLLVAGFNNARTWWPGENYTWGTAAYHVHERYGLHF